MTELVQHYLIVRSQLPGHPRTGELLSDPIAKARGWQQAQGDGVIRFPRVDHTRP